MIRALRWLIVCGLVVPPLAAAAESSSSVPSVPEFKQAGALERVRHLAIQHNGRLKPFDSFAWESIEAMTGSPVIAGQDPVATVFAIAAFPSDWSDAKILAVPFVPLRQQLGLDRKQAHVSLNELLATRKLMRMLPPIVQKQQRDEKLSMLETETMDLFNRFVTFNSLMKQEFHLVPPSEAGSVEWTVISQTPLQSQWQAVVHAFQNRDGEQFAQAVAAFGDATRQVNPSAYPSAWRLNLEVVYNHATPFRIARWLYALTALLFLAAISRPNPRAHGLAFAALVTAFTVHGAGIAMRVILGGRPPVSNFFETMLWLPFVAVLLSMIFERVTRSSFFGLAASILAGIVLLLAAHVPLDSSISPVVAVLHSNLWLTVHVLTVVASYGALGLAVVLAHVYAWLYLIQRGAERELGGLEGSIYRATQVGVVLLAGGIMLGAVWANASWGRYWGWDPKETWALITLIWYLAVFHGRFAGWLKGVWMSLSTIAGAFLLLMTYYGVSFYLVGLHSYAGGHAKPLPPLLIAYLIAELAFLGVVSAVAIRHRRLA